MEIDNEIIDYLDRKCLQGDKKACILAEKLKSEKNIDEFEEIGVTLHEIREEERNKEWKEKWELDC